MKPMPPGIKWEKTTKRSLWRRRHRDVWNFICPLCEIERRVPFRPQPGGVRQIFQILLTSIMFTLCTWPWFGWKGIVSFVPFWTLFEVVYRWRMRAALACVNCGFDPYLFLIDESWAKREVETHWRKKFADKGIPFPGDPEPVSVAAGASPGGEESEIQAKQAPASSPKTPTKSASQTSSSTPKKESQIALT